MMHRIKHILFTTLAFASVPVIAQDTAVLRLDTILARIEQSHPLLQSYGLKAEGYKYSAEAATAWMAPMVGLGTFMTPYPFQKIMEDRDKGNIMLQLEQDIPNAAKLRTKKAYIASQADGLLAERGVSLNELRAQAKTQYYSWLMALERIRVLDEAIVLMEMMKKIEEVRYPYNQSPLSGVFKAESRVEENRNMKRMYEGEIQKARAWLNALMNRRGTEFFLIDTTHAVSFMPQLVYDTLQLAASRKDIARMNADINSMQLGIHSIRQEKKPDFRIRFDHMTPISSMMPNAFSAMGMVSIPIAPWSKRMYKNEIKAMELNIQAMQKEREAMLQETQGMLYGMQSEILVMQKRIENFGTKVIPALERSLDADFQLYQENKQQLAVVISDWEALVMMKMNLVDEKSRLYKMIVDYEKELYK
ncbi:TolC family protein [Flavihumibacter cheonanensis]|uniref:TolC family protein n=1 Tax=Flavihumibacter cheonanensis TaxID=1442385 RepID=UPI001EF96E02|nr:TolC family protein [Flavihumibacter cheonanensis]MCG7753844.1 TolC family protein [Flavihumibacter cheonanensis]